MSKFIPAIIGGILFIIASFLFDLNNYNRMTFETKEWILKIMGIGFISYLWFVTFNLDS